MGIDLFLLLGAILLQNFYSTTKSQQSLVLVIAMTIICSVFQLLMGSRILSLDFFALWADFIPLWIFFILLFLDSSGTIKQLWYSFVHALKIFVYTLPLWIVLLLFAVIFIRTPLFGLSINPAFFIFLFFLFKSFVILIWEATYKEAKSVIG